MLELIEDYLFSDWHTADSKNDRDEYNRSV